MGEADKYLHPDQDQYAPNYQQQQQQQQYPPQYGQQNPYQQQQPAFYDGSGDQSQPPPPVNYQQQQGNGYNNSAPPNGYAQPPNLEGEKMSFDQSFKIDKPKFNDLWAGILFLVVFAGYVAISGLAIYGYSQTSSGGIYDSTTDFALNSNTIILFAIVLGIAFLLSWGYVWLARMFPKQFIWVTGILNVCFAIGTAIFYLYKKYYSAGIIFLIFGLFMAFCFYTWISRIPFSALMLKTSIDVSKKYGHVYLVSLLGGILGTALAAWYSVTLVAIYIRYQPDPNSTACSELGGCSNAKVIGFIAFVTFAMYWISEWLKNTIHTTISGVYGSWYFYPNNFPQAATRGALKRALTYSFGSICLGSLLVAIVQFMRQLCSVARSQANSGGGIGGAIGGALFCVLGCLIGLLEWAVKFLNRYAFSHIALYGKAYIAAAKDTWKMIKNRGIDALINECLIGPVLSFGAMFIGYACALVGYIYLLVTDPAYNQDGAYTPVVIAFSFLIGFQIANIFTTPLSSGIDTIFVAAGWDPQVMMTEHPELYNEMVKLYPKVQQAIRS